MFKLVLLLCLGFVAFVAAQSCTTSASCDNVGFCQAAEDTGCGYCDCVSGTCTVKEIPGFPTRGEECFTFSSSDVGRCYEGRCRFDYCQTQECYFGVRQTDGTCDPNQLTVIAGASCNDGVGCTIDDKCSSAGICAGTPQSSLCAPDPNPCLETSCSPTEGCVTTGLAGPCEGCVLPPGASPDCYECVCLDGECIANALGQATCDSGNDCTVGSCQANTGGVFVCRASNAPIQTPCDDHGSPACATSGVCDGSGSCFPVLDDQFCRDLIPDGNDCEDRVCSPSATTADENGCATRYKTGVCRAGTGLCNPEERCDGSSPTCPDDFFLREGEVCLQSFGVCEYNGTCLSDAGECSRPTLKGTDEICYQGSGAPNGGIVCDPPVYCDGVSVGCPSNSVLPRTTVCRPASDIDCDQPEYCPGVDGQPCPEDQDKPDGTECENCNFPPGSDEQCLLCACDQGTCQYQTSAGPCEVDNDCYFSGICQDDSPFDCIPKPGAEKPAGTPCGVSDGNPCTENQCDGNGACRVVDLSDTPCANAECSAGTCLSGTCLCPCEVDCVLTRGAVERNSPGAKGKDRNDPVWETDLFQNTEVCDLILNDWFNKKNSLPSGCENDLFAQYFTVLYNIERYKLSTGTTCVGLADEPEVQALLDEIETLLSTLDLTTCQTLMVDGCAQKVDVLRLFNEGNNTVPHCDSSLPIEVAFAGSSAGNHTDKTGGSDDDDDLGAGGIIAIVFGSLVGVIILALLAFIIFGAMGNIWSKDTKKKSKKGYRRQADESNDSF